MERRQSGEEEIGLILSEISVRDHALGAGGWEWVEEKGGGGGLAARR